MRFLADENIPLPSIHFLRSAGHAVIAIAEDAPSIADVAVLQLAVQEQSILLTFDRDFGELLFRAGADAPLGIVYFRGRPATPVEPGDRVLQLLRLDVVLNGYFTVVERDHVRQRLLPPTASE